MYTNGLVDHEASSPQLPNGDSNIDEPSPEISSAHDEGPPLIAIVGMAARLPGGVSSMPAMYEFLRAKKDGLCDVPPSRFNIDGFYNDGDTAYSMKHRKAYFLEDAATMMDASFFGLSEVEAAGSDPRARLLLEVVYECLENAGKTDYRGEKIGCYIGAWGVDWVELTLKDGQQRNPLLGAAAGSFFLSSYIAWNLDLHGPTGVLSPSGLCKTFDASADGFGRAEAVNAILVKPLNDAIRDGDAIRAVIRATSVNNDGRTLALSTPSAEAQAELIQHAYRKARINDIGNTAYFECHGTGTMAGDIAEMSAVARIFPDGIQVGSVKPNFGHSEGTSGLTSLMKAVISLENRTLLPHIHMTEPNPKIPFQSARLVVPKEQVSWPQGRKERITPCRPRLLVVSASSEKSLLKRIEDTEAYFQKKPHILQDLAYTLGERREHLSRKAFCLAKEPPISESFNIGPADYQGPPQTTFVFTGQGAQWPDMGKSLFESFDRFRQSIQLLDQALQTVGHPPSWGLEDLLCNNRQADIFNQAEYAQPLCCAIQIGLVDLLSDWGITPTSVIGHSSGEISAAYAAGAITAADAIKIAYHRGQILHKVTRRGAMAAVSYGRDKVSPYVVDGVVVACENSQHTVTLSGAHDQVSRVLEKIKHDDPDALCRLLRVDKAYHSPHMQDVADDYEALLDDLTTIDTSSAIPLFSTVTGAKITDSAELNAGYWRRNLESPVLFLTATRAIIDSSEAETQRSFVEIGPHSALSGPIRQILSDHERGESCSYIPSLVRGEDPTTSILHTAGNLYNYGAPVQARVINGPGNILVDLPPYPWHHEKRYWSQTPAVEAWRLRKHPHHELLGSRVLGSTDLEPSWQNTLALDDASWLYGHRVMGKTLFPGAGYIAMAGEAIQQITGSPGLAYQINHLLLKSALFVETNEIVQLITNLRPARISDIQDSSWYEFSITSVQSGETTRLCVGQVRLAATTLSPKPVFSPTTALKRPVNPTTWYKYLRDIGMDYGREFRGLDNVYADPVRYEATATVRTAKVSSSRYIMHPTVIDRCLQLLSVAMFRGLSRNIDIRSLPVLFEDVFIGPEGEELHVQAQADPGKGSFIIGDLSAVSGNKTTLSIRGLRLHVLGDDGPDQGNEIAARVAWRPHMNFIPTTTIARPPPAQRLELDLRDKVVDLYILETAAKVDDVEPSDEHLRKYKRWLSLGKSRISNEGHWSLSEFGYTAECPFDSSNSADMIEWLREKADLYPELAPMVLCMHRVLDNIVAVFEGTRNPLHLLVEDDGLKDVYDTILSFDTCNEFFASLGHSLPELNILEIGAGTGSATARFLEYLHAPDGTRLYSQYTFTDISAGFLAAAKDRFSRYDAIEYAVLDITQDPAIQGFKLDTYDLIIASNVVHATPSLRQSLSNIKSLLAPGGRLFLQELAEDCRGAEYIFGLLPGWWVGEADGRPDKPYVPLDRWKKELISSGFDGIDFAIFEETSLVVNMVSTRPVQLQPSRTVNLLIPDVKSEWVVKVETQLQAKGYKVNCCSLREPPGSDGEVISLLDASEPFLYNIAEEQFQQLKGFLLSPAVKRVLWVTKMSQIGCSDPRYGLIHGFLRAIHGERYTEGISISTFDVERFDDDAITHLLGVNDNLNHTLSSEESLRDEYALSDGVVHVGRYETTDLEKELQRPLKQDTPRRLGIESTGLIDSMFWREEPPSSPGVGQDVITAMGLIATPDQLGLEGSGVIQAVGSGVSNIRPGDQVIFLGPGCFATHINIPATRVIVLPEGWSLEEGATSPIVSITAAQCLLKLGNLKAGQSVLIHAACGGVGIAAIRICKVIGATIYATVGSESKVQYLMDTFDIPRSHIFHSRDSSFHPDIMRETKGRGVDIVLSSLSGELLQTSWMCVAPGGTMFDISRRDVLADAVLPMKQFVDRRSFISMDLGEYMDEARDQSADFSRPVEEGLVGPISPVSCFDMAEVADAFRYMQTGKHVGKILVRMPDDPSTLPTREGHAEVSFSPDYAYLLSGGLGGLGRAVSNWMVEKGARHLIFLSPSAGFGDDHAAFAEELACQGCEVIYVQGTASEPSDVQKAIDQSPRPVKGVFQLALALKDTSFERMTFEDWTIPLTAKVRGTWNLHQAFQNMPLDFFVMFGSVAGNIGMAGQCNYSAANTFIHALARHRHSLGQPASVLDLGPVADIGFISRSPELVKSFSGRYEWRFIREQEVLNAVETLIHRSSSVSLAAGLDPDRYDYSHIILGLTSAATWLRQRGDSRLAILSNRAQRQQENAAALDDIVDFVAQVESDPELLNRPSTEEFLIKKVGYMIKAPTSKTVAATVDMKALANIPIDSLIAIETRAWARKRLGVQISLSDITAAGNVKGLVNLAIEGLKKRFLTS
ncbi:acyl transferase domain-containing protein [Aspergillus crustosus]